MEKLIKHANGQWTLETLEKTKRKYSFSDSQHGENQHNYHIHNADGKNVGSAFVNSKGSYGVSLEGKMPGHGPARVNLENHLLEHHKSLGRPTGGF